MRSDVIIVGGGASGLACAAALSRHDISVVILEARRIIGGRIRTYHPPDGGPTVELGAQVIHGIRNPVRELAALGLAGPSSPPSHPLPRDMAARAVIHGKTAPMGVLARGGPPPWAVESRLTTGGGDDLPVAAWLADQRLTGDHLLAAAEWFRQNWAADPQVLSAGGVARARQGENCGDGEYGFDCGFDALTGVLAAGLDIRVDTPARAITWSPGQVEVTTAAGTRATGRAAVITAPPPVVAAGRLSISPMPAGKSEAARALPSGDGVCAVVTLSEPAPESAVVFDVDGQGGFARCAKGRPEALIVAKGRAATAVRAADLTSLLGRLFPRWPAAGVTGTRIADWGRDPWSAGVFSYPAVGASWAAPAWSAPAERTLFFAGEATTAGSLPPSVHGAVTSGLRAASEVVEALGR